MSNKKIKKQLQVTGTLGFNSLDEFERGDYVKGNYFVANIHFRAYDEPNNYEVKSLNNFCNDLRKHLIEQEGLTAEEVKPEIDKIFKIEVNDKANLRVAGADKYADRNYGNIYQNSKYMKFKSGFEVNVFTEDKKEIPVGQRTRDLPIGSIVIATITIDPICDNRKLKGIMFYLHSIQRLGYREERGYDVPEKGSHDASAVYEVQKFIGNKKIPKVSVTTDDIQDVDDIPF